MRGIERRIAAGRDPSVALGRLAVRQPLGRGGRGQGARRAAQPARHRRRQRRPTRAYRELLASDRAGSASRTPARGRSGCSGRAPAPRTRPPPTSSTSRRWPRRTPSTRCPTRRCTPSPTTAASRGAAAARRRRRRGDARRVRAAPASTSTRSRAQLQQEGAEAFAKSWNELLDCIARKRDALLGANASDERGAVIDALRRRDAWQALAAHAAEVRDVHLRDLFAEDPERGERLAAEAAGLYLDYSKNRVTDETLRLLVAARRGARRARAHRGDVPRRARSTSPRTARCCTSRCARPRSARIDRRRRRRRRRGPRACSTGWPTSPSASARASGRATPASRIRNVVNIGIGGSDLGPVMAYEALRHYSRARPDLPLRLQRRRHRLRGGDARPRPGGDAVHRLARRRSRRSRR